MATVSPLNAAPLLANALSVPASPLPVSTSALAPPNPALPEPSSIVTIAPGNLTNSQPTYSIPSQLTFLPPTVTWANDSSDAISEAMAGAYKTEAITNQAFFGLGNVGSALLDRLGTTDGDFSQSLQVTPADSLGALGSTAQGPQADIELTIETKSGVEVDITLHSGADGMTVSEHSSGKLSAAEQSALGNLSGAFQDAINGLTAIPPTLDLSGLTQFDPSVLASVHLQSNVTGEQPPQPIQSIDFQANSATRTVTVGGTAGTLNVNVDTAESAILGNRAQQAAAIADYLKQFDEADSRGRGDASFMAMFKDAFTQMLSGSDTSPSQSLPGTTYAPSLAEVEHAMLTGLPDFNASITDAAQSTNPMRLSEQDTFSYQVSQSTDIEGNQQGGTITQKQQSHLIASYHESLTGMPLALTSKMNSQTYDYVQINDTANSTTEIDNENGKLVKASLSQSADQSTRDSKYEMGELVSDITTPAEESQSRDLLALLRPFYDGRQVEQDSGKWQQALSSLHDMIFLQPNPADLSANSSESI
ncbi:hypothetical protein [Burkholderia sp. L27(2015)]|uniref:hypothetical protein n=1 Tax=Burkholderia sp. L27(2015) TaxID=1641858 RepID=UPI00131CC39F|nr:hypothetical protein [Burkholderia sp. L27(2015)]